VDVKQVGRELGVRYVLEGSVRKSANRVRITGQLIDASTGAHIWADRFDGAIEDISICRIKLRRPWLAQSRPKWNKPNRARQAQADRKSGCL